MSLLSQKHLQDEEAAYAFVEAHLWPNGPVCPHCFEDSRISKMAGKATRFGLYKCYACRKQFRVTVKTIFEKSHVPLHLWLQAFYLIAGSKKGISANQLHRTLGLTLKTAWFVGHRIREAMRSGSLLPPMGGSGKVVEVDEAFIGSKDGVAKRRGRGNYQHKQIALALVERGGRVRSFHIDRANSQNIEPIVMENVAHETAIMTDSAKLYQNLGRTFKRHESVNHKAEEWVLGDAHTNTVESYFSVFKRGMKGTYQHCSGKALAQVSGGVRFPS